VKLQRVSVSSDHDDADNFLTTTIPLRITVDYWNSVPGLKLNVSLVLYTIEDVCVFNSCSDGQTQPTGLIRSQCVIPAHFLNDEAYRIRILLVRDGPVVLFDRDHLVTFSVTEGHRQGAWFGKWIGVVHPDLEWNTEPVETSKLHRASPVPQC
jgi:lipopolysaccharide transport system ATP-binding protein